ncbi:MAG TPA: NAD-dependent epimerase/dehydratase family protein [Nitrososphaerales archaeon]|nr:NAD-dependent epimerase/dehydratase family protein [Nitrososphaerales archaeon]
MKILVTGGGGYIGTTLVPFLLQKGHQVTVLDRFYFGQELCERFSSLGSLTLVRQDTRTFDGNLLEGVDAVVDMAALSNDPAGELDPWKTIEINYLGRSRVARLAKQANVKRYLLISSCSIYGFQDGILTEESKTNPLTAYARANMLAEKDNLPLGDEEFTSTTIRFATVYGLSERMRFDLAINGMVLGAVKTGKIPIMRDGTQWRPFIHVKDAARAILAILEAEPEKVNKQLFNIGSDTQNFQIKELAEIVANSLSKRPTIEWYGDPDRRSYKVSFGKAKRVLGYETKYTPVDAVREIEFALVSNQVTDSIRTKTVEWYKHLLNDGQASKEVALGVAPVL